MQYEEMPMWAYEITFIANSDLVTIQNTQVRV